MTEIETPPTGSTAWQDAKPFVALGVCYAAFTLAGVGLAYLLDGLHAVSPNNALAGFGCALGGSLVGLIVGAVLAFIILEGN